jgi:hypothetical protein
MVIKELNTASNNANEVDEIPFSDFKESMMVLSTKAKTIGRKHCDPFIKCFGLGIEYAIAGAKTGKFDFPHIEQKHNDMNSNIIPDYKEREELFEGIIVLCDATLPDLLDCASPAQLKSLGLIVMLATMFREKKVTNILSYFKLAEVEFVKDDLMAKVADGAVPSER